MRVSLAGEGREEANWRLSGDKLSEAPWFLRAGWRWGENWQKKSVLQGQEN